MITDEMMIAAVKAHTDVDGKARPAALRAALEAAFAAMPKPEPVAYRHRLVGAPLWFVSNDGDPSLANARCFGKNFPEKVEIEPLYTAQPAPAVSVKALVWTEPAKPNEECSYDHVRAVGAWTYQIEWKSWKEFGSFTVYRDGDFVCPQDTLKAAKAAAQRDYETRILSALNTSSEPAAPVVPEGWQLVPKEPTDAWAETYCDLVNRHPDGSQTSFISDGPVTVTFRDLSKGEIAAMLAAAPEAPHE